MQPIKIEKDIEVLESSVETLTQQITRLAKYYSPLQVKTWRKRRADLNKKLKAYKQQLKDVSAPTKQLTLKI